MLRVKLLTSLSKVFSDEEPDGFEKKSYSVLKNEILHFQTAIFSDCDTNLNVNFDSGLNSKVYLVKEVPVGLAAYEDSDDYYLRKTPGLYPDLLVPFEQGTGIVADKWYSLFFEIGPFDDKAGNITFDFTVNDEPVSLEIEIIDKMMPVSETVYTNWFHSDCLADYYHVEVFSDEYWRIVRNFVTTASKHGMNCILTPVFTPALDTGEFLERTTVQLVDITLRGKKYLFGFSNLKKWVDVCTECGIMYFEINHFFTQWGAKHAPKIIARDRKGREKKIFGWKTKSSGKDYSDFLRQFSVAFKSFIDRNNLKDRVFIHISDEPSLNQLKAYRSRAYFIRSIFKGYKVIDALSDYDFYKLGAVDIPVPSENHFSDFYGKAEHIWTYCCCGQHKDYLPNRFIAMPSLRNRIIGFLLYRYDIEGFLHWGYNFYNSQLSLRKIDPYKETDAGKAFPAGDPFIVYPAPDGTAYESLRLKVLSDAFQDMRALKLLESISSDSVADSYVENLTFNSYPHSEEWFFNTREQINKKIKELSVQ